MSRAPTTEQWDNVDEWRRFAGELLREVEHFKKQSKRRNALLNRVERAVREGDIAAAERVFEERARFIEEARRVP